MSAKDPKSREFLLGLFSEESRLMEAIRRLRGGGVVIFDVLSPYAIHELDVALGHHRSRLPIVTFLAGLGAMALSLFFQLWVTGVDWPLNVGGKPNDVVVQFLPVTFELTVLIGGLTTAALFFVRTRLYPGARPPLSEISQDFRMTDHHFVLLVERRDASFDEKKVVGILQESGAEEIVERRVLS